MIETIVFLVFDEKGVQVVLGFFDLLLNLIDLSDQLLFAVLKVLNILFFFESAVLCTEPVSQQFGVLGCGKGGDFLIFEISEV